MQQHQLQMLLDEEGRRQPQCPHLADLHHSLQEGISCLPTTQRYLLHNQVRSPKTIYNIAIS